MPQCRALPRRLETIRRALCGVYLRSLNIPTFENCPVFYVCETGRFGAAYSSIYANRRRQYSGNAASTDLHRGLFLHFYCWQSGKYPEFSCKQKILPCSQQKTAHQLTPAFPAASFIHAAGTGQLVCSIGMALKEYGRPNKQLWFAVREAW